MDTDLLAAILYTLQGANWQRSGGRGDRPKPLERPKEKQSGATSAGVLPDKDVTVSEQSAALDDEIQRRRADRLKKQGRLKVG